MANNFVNPARSKRPVGYEPQYMPYYAANPNMMPDLSKNNKINQSVSDKTKKKKALAEIDTFKFGRFQLRTILVAGIGFFTVPTDIDTLVKSAAQVGALLGQLVFGYLGDKYGRKKMYGIELLIMLVGTVGASLSSNLESGVSLFVILGLWRLLMGFGIGGDYPVSAVLTSEFANTRFRGSMIAAVFGMQGFGILFGGIVTVIFLAIFKSAIVDDITKLDNVWRLCLAFGCVPCLIAIYFRLTIPETPRYTMHIENNIDKGVNDIKYIRSGKKDKNLKNKESESNSKPTFKEAFQYFTKWKNGKVLLGTSVCWFALDVGFYGINLNLSNIISAIGYGGGAISYHNVTNNATFNTQNYNYLFDNAVGNILVALMGTVPGYWVTVALIDRIGRKPIQLIGFAFLGILSLIIGIAYHKLLEVSQTAFIILFTLMQFFQNFGPNATTFVIPGEVFQTRFRSSGHGFSAAMGKLGAIVSSAGLFQIKDYGGDNEQVPTLLIIFSGFMLVGFVFTFLLPETKGKTLEELGDD